MFALMFYVFFFFLMIRRPPRSTLFPYTTLFRSPNTVLTSFVLDVEKAFDQAIKMIQKGNFNGQVFKPGLEAYKGADRKSTRLNSSHANISYAVFCLKKKKTILLRRITLTRPRTS